jgi:HTH-type transcriptional regulator/antitoxin HigA
MTLINHETYKALLGEFQPKIITSEEEYDRALAAVEKLMAKRERTPEHTEILKLLVLLIEKYENENYPMDEASPQDVLEHLMEARGLKQVDLVGIIGSKGVVSEIVNGKRSISKAQAKALGELFNVSPSLFI